MHSRVREAEQNIIVPHCAEPPLICQVKFASGRPKNRPAGNMRMLRPDSAERFDYKVINRFPSPVPPSVRHPLRFTCAPAHPRAKTILIS